jgi:hypothetical protein
MTQPMSPVSETSAERPALAWARASTVSVPAEPGEYLWVLTPSPRDRRALGAEFVQLTAPANFSAETHLSLVTPIRSRGLFAGSLARRRSRRRHWEPSDA